MSLALFDQESLIILPEEEGKKGVINENSKTEAQVPHSGVNLRPSMHMSFAGNAKTDFTFDSFRMQVILGNQAGAIETMRRFKFSDVLFFRVIPQSSIDVWLLGGTVCNKQLNLIQFAVAMGQD